MATLHQPSGEPGLFIVTTNTVYLRHPDSEKTLFECETRDGIVSARASKDNSSLFAVADGHVVILYDPTRGKDKKYQLSSGHVGYPSYDATLSNVYIRVSHDWFSSRPTRECSFILLH